LSKEAIDVILPYGNNQLLICTNNGLFVHNGKSVKPLNAKTNEFFQQFRLNRAIQLHNGQYLFGTLLNGIVLTDQQGNILRHINQRQGLQNNTVLTLFEDKTHNVWVGLDKGIDLLMLSSPLRFYRDLEGYLGTVYDIESLNGWLYVGTNQGVL
jgi:ligand-binding sensor domain-containing protein